MNFLTSLGFIHRNCSCAVQTYELHTFLLFHSHVGGAIMASEEFTELQALSPGLEFQKKSVRCSFFFFPEMRDAVFTASGSYSFCWHTSVLISSAFTLNSLHQSFYVCLTAGFSARMRRWCWRCCFGCLA